MASSYTIHEIGLCLVRLLRFERLGMSGEMANWWVATFFSWMRRAVIPQWDFWNRHLLRHWDGCGKGALCKVFWRWLKPDSLFIKTDSCSEDRPLTVSELNQSVLTADPQIIEFLCTAKVIQSEKGGVILAAVDVLRRLWRRFLLSRAFFFVITQALWLPPGTMWNYLQQIRQMMLYLLLLIWKWLSWPTFKLEEHPKTQRAPLPDFVGDGDQHEQVQNPIASMVPAGNSSTVVEIVDDLAAKLGETTDVNHQTPSSTVPEGGRPASSTPPVDRYESEKKKLRLA